MRICDKLGKFPHEVEALSCDEFDRLVAFYVFESQEAGKQSKSNKNPNDILRERGL